jgi:hypothetical protein
MKILMQFPNKYLSCVLPSLSILSS